MKMAEHTDYFEELAAALQNSADHRALYMVMNSVYLRSLNEYTRGIRLPMSGPFAKTDYLLKERGASREVSNGINDTRQYLRQRWQKSETELREHYRTDLRNLCEFLSLLSGEAVPSALTLHFPEKRKGGGSPTLLLGEYLRVIVVRWDDDYAYCRSETTGYDELRVCFSHGNKAYDYDRSYLKRLFYEGAQFNLIRPYQQSGVVYPELWIFEPDYLMDISSIAACFDTYAESAMVGLMKRIDKRENTAAILLGHMASQLLDESIHQLPDTWGYADSAKEFFSHYALTIMGTEDFNSQDFHRQARSQQVNINQAIGHTLPESIQGFDSRNGIVEPSFFSEMLGLQGRMDFLQLDMKVLIEQKSGKGEFPQNGFIVPKPKLDHTVQLLLYMTVLRYNYRKQYEAIGRNLHAFLLYSKYRDSLYDAHFAPELLFDALKTRNEMAWNDIVRFREEGYGLLTTLTPDKLNEKRVNNTLWQRFTYPQLHELLSSIKTCSDLERKYCLRLLQFMGEEHVVSKLGNRERDDAGFASTWQLSLEEKTQLGTIMTGLSLDLPDEARDKRISEVRFEMENHETRFVTNLRKGDIVVLHPYAPSEEPDLRTTMAIRGTLKAMDKDTVTVKLRSPQSDSRIFDYHQGKLWAMEADFMESSFSRAYANIYSFLSAPKSRRDLLLLQREPEVDKSRSLRGDYGDFNTLALRVKQAKDLFLIIGPPGTGKTSFGMLNTLQEELLEPGSRVLLMSFTNRAVDEMCSKLVEAGIDFIRIGNELSCDEAYLSHHISKIGRESENVNALRYKIERCRVFAGTVASFNSQLQFLESQQTPFSLAIIDEASQLLEPHLIGLLSSRIRPSRGLGASIDRPTIGKFVLIGDHKQLPAVVQQAVESSRVDDKDLEDIGLTDCGHSLFERLHSRFRDNPAYEYMLTRHGRMHPEIARFPNEQFYDGKLQPVPLPHQEGVLPADVDCRDDMERMLRTKRVAFVSVDGPECSLSDKSNMNEAVVIAKLIERIRKIEGSGFDASTVGVIVPYRNQIATIRSVLSGHDAKELEAVTIDTVERFQGSQRKYIIYGFTVQKRYQLRFLTGNVIEDQGKLVDRKLNVAMTRAKEHLIMVGNPAVICQDGIFKKLVEYVKKEKGYYLVDSL